VNTAVVRRIRTIALLVIVAIVAGWFLFGRPGPSRRHFSAVFEPLR